MFEIKNLTNEVQHLCFRSGKELLLSGKESIANIRELELTPVLMKMNERRIISIVKMKTAQRSSAKKAKPADHESDKKDKKQ